jgi:hypothetical protein
MLTLAVLATIALGWDIVQAGSIAQQRRSPPPLGTLAGLSVLLAAPALLVAVATGSTITGSAVAGVAWIWPVTAAVFVAESMYVTFRRLITPFVGVPIMLYNGLVFAVATTRYVQAGAGAAPGWALVLGAVQADVLGAVAGPIVLAAPWAVLVPLVAPAFPARRPLARIARGAIALLAGACVVSFVVRLPAGVSAVRSYDRYLAAELQERPGGDFSIGVRILPPLDGMPPALELRNDLALVDTIGAEAVSIVINPDGVHPTALDSLAHVLDPLRRDSTSVFITLGSPWDAARRYAASPSRSDADRLADLRRIARRLHPDYLVVALDGARGDADAGLSVVDRTRYLAAAADSIHAIDPHIRIALAISPLDGRDSAIYAWAVSPQAPIDAIGFTLYPGFTGAQALDTQMQTADRWMQHVQPPFKEHWVIAVGGYPVAHGEEAQQLGIWGSLAWSTGRAVIKGAIVVDAADYDDITGLRAPSGRLRPAAIAVMRAVQALRDRRD